MSDIALFINAGSASIPTSQTRVMTSGYSVVGEGAAFYVNDAAVDGAYVAANPRTAFVSSNGRGFRLDSQQPLTIQMFGGRADGTALSNVGATAGAYGATDNSAALAAALLFIQAGEIVIGSNQYYRGGPRIHFPAADGVYDFQSTINVKSTVIISGDGGTSGQPATMLRWRPGMHGIIVHYFDTVQSGTTSPANYGGDGTHIEHVSLYQHRDDNSVHTEDYHGIWLRARATIRNFGVSGFSGNGINVVAGAVAGGIFQGNANNFRVENGFVVECEHGIFVDGGDANAGHVIGVDASSNRGYGIWDSSFLGNTYLACHTSDNGHATRNPDGKSSICHYAGNWYHVVPGQSVAARTTTPGTNEAVWHFLEANGPSPMAPTWISGLTIWRDGGGYCFDGTAARNLVLGCYSEGGQGGNYAIGPTLLVGGDLYYGFYGWSPYLNALHGTVETSSGFQHREARATGEIAITLGGQSSGIGDDILRFWNPAKMIGTEGANYGRLGWGGVNPVAGWKDIVFNEGHPVLNRWAFFITGNNTDRTFGRSTVQPYVFGADEIAVGREGRIHQSGSAAPTTGHHAKGEVCWNDHTNGANDAVDYWICKTAGTPGTWVARP